MDTILRPKYSKYLHSKIELRRLRIYLQRIKLLINWDIFKGIQRVKGILKRIELQKQIFIIELENNYGQANLVPKDLSQDHLAYSFRFYDPLIRIVQNNMCEDLQSNIAI